MLFAGKGILVTLQFGPLQFRIDEFGISFAHASVRGHSTKQAASAAEVAREEYFFCGPSPGMFLFIPCLSQMTSEISHGSLLTARYRTRLYSLSLTVTSPLTLSLQQACRCVVSQCGLQSLVL